MGSSFVVRKKKTRVSSSSDTSFVPFAFLLLSLSTR